MRLRPSNQTPSVMSQNGSESEMKPIQLKKIALTVPTCVADKLIYDSSVEAGGAKHPDMKLWLTSFGVLAENGGQQTLLAMGNPVMSVTPVDMVPPELWCEGWDQHLAVPEVANVETGTTYVSTTLPKPKAKGGKSKSK